MDINSDNTRHHIDEIQQRIDSLLDSIRNMGNEVTMLRSELYDIRRQMDNPPARTVQQPAPDPEPAVVPQPPVHVAAVAPKVSVTMPPAHAADPNVKEKFWGQNVLGKIGICIAVLGIIALLRYLFNRDFMTTAVKVGLGYVAGAVAVGLSYKYLKTRRILSSILYIGGVMLSYSLTFLSCRYFGLFSSTASVVVSGSIALFSCVVGYIWSMPVLNVSALLLYFVPIGSNVYLHDSNFAAWAFFACTLMVALCAVGIVRRSQSPVVSALAIWLLFSNNALLDAPDSVGAPILLVGFSIVFVFQTVITIVNRNYSAMLWVMIVNSVSAYISLASVSDNGMSLSVLLLVVFAMFAASSFLTQYLVGDGKMSNISLVFAVVFFNLAMFQLMAELSSFYYIGDIVMAEAALLLFMRYRLGRDVYEDASYVLYVIGIFLMTSVFSYYAKHGNICPLFNTGFISFMLFAVASYLFSVYYSQKHSVLPYVVAFVALMVGIITEDVVYWSGRFHRNFFMWVSLEDICLMYFMAMLYLSKYSRYSGKMRGISGVMLLIIQGLFCFPIMIVFDRAASYYFSRWEVVSLAAMSLSVILMFRTQLGRIDRTKEVLQYFYIMTVVWEELVLKFGGSRSLQMWISLLMALYAGALFFIGFRFRKKEVRWFGIILAIIISLKIVVYDVWYYSLAVKAVVFLLVGGIFLLISYLYSKYLKDKE